MDANAKHLRCEAKISGASIEFHENPLIKTPGGPRV